MQERAGLDVVNDGEWRRRSYIGVIAELAHGFTLEINPADGRPWTVVTEKLTPKPAGFIAGRGEVREAGRARSRTKITLPAPALLGERLWDAERSKKAYPKRDDFVRDCVAPLRARDRADAGHRRRHRADRRPASVPVRRSRRAHDATTIPTAPPTSPST